MAISPKMSHVNGAGGGGVRDGGAGGGAFQEHLELNSHALEFSLPDSI